MKTVLVDSNWKKLLPLTYTRPVSYVRCGVLKIHEKWDKYLGSSSESVSEEYLNSKFFKEFEGPALILNSKYLPSTDYLSEISNLESGEMLIGEEGWMAIKSDVGFKKESWEGLQSKKFRGEVTVINSWWDLFKVNRQEIENDYKLITDNRTSLPLSKSNILIGPSDRIFIEEGAYVEGCILNTNDGPIYIGKDVEVMEGAIIRGAFSVLEGSKIKLGAKIYGPTSVGPKCRIGGEVKNSIIQGYSNKSHDGYLGNSIVGEWVNLGADTNCSNLKNTFSGAKVWNYESGTLEVSGEVFIGACFGDYSKTGINTMINTGTVIGVNANVFGEGFPPKYIPSFSWGENEKYQFERAWKVNVNIAEMAGEQLTKLDKKILKNIQESPLEIFE
jgi:UDP-N-acetylglucosamine diphosphorylase/glucosamine-1-phosphate N-acetyltransferase